MEMSDVFNKFTAILNESFQDVKDSNMRDDEKACRLDQIRSIVLKTIREFNVEKPEDVE